MKKKLLLLSVFLFQFTILFADTSEVKVVSNNSNTSEANQNACISNMTDLYGSVKIYNFSSDNPMKELNIDTLVKMGCLPHTPNKPDPKCEYELTEDGVKCALHGNLPNDIKSKMDNIFEKRTCLSNLKVLVGAIEMFSVDHKDNPMKKLDIPTLVNNKYLKFDPKKSNPNCEYELTDDGDVKCSLHGSLNGAKKNECFSNSRVIAGAIEMYNMDFEEPMKKLDMDTLVKLGYMRKITNKPDPKCEYESVGDMTTDGYIKCVIHGSPMMK